MIDSRKWLIKHLFPPSSCKKQINKHNSCLLTIRFRSGIRYARVQTFFAGSVCTQCGCGSKCNFQICCIKLLFIIISVTFITKEFGKIWILTIACLYFLKSITCFCLFWETLKLKHFVFA